MPNRRTLAGRVTRTLIFFLGLFLLMLSILAGWLWWRMERSVPALDGDIQLSGLASPVTVARDSLGTATITAESRADAARALGYLHAQDRYFSMDMLRRYAAGELSELSGDATLEVDRSIRPHRFRARAQAIVTAMPAEERAVLDAYVAGVNAGLSDLPANPFEYVVLRGEPEPWKPEDTVLAAFAMYLNLQPALPQRELDRARAEKALGREMSAFLYPETTELDAPIDGSILPEPPMPARIAPQDTPSLPLPVDVRLPETVGSNNWAVGGKLTASGTALVANDMHLGLDVPSTWYRARIIVKPRAGSSEKALDAVGVTLPGTPNLVAGSNGRIAWGYTNSYIDTADAVIVEWIDERQGSYRTPQGPATISAHEERICAHSACEGFVVRETIWGPIVAKDAFGRDIAMRWTAHEPDAIRLGMTLRIEQASNVPEALALARQSGIPQQNFTVGDRDGNIGWTIIGQVPNRFGFSGQEAVSFADGTRGWNGYAANVPVVLNPAGDRIWTANSRVVGGEGFAVLGDGGYDTGARAGRIRDLLQAKDKFAPADFLNIQLDDVSVRNAYWQELMLAELRKRSSDERLQAMIGPVENWGGRALPRSSGYRLVERFRAYMVEGLYEAWLGLPEKGPFRRTWMVSQSEGPARRLLRERPAALVPKGHASWDAYIDAALAKVAEDVETQAGGRIEDYRWGSTAKAGVSHPLARALPMLGWVTNPENVPVPGDRATVRASAPGFGASERFAVSPGREAEGLFQMPGGQAGSPASPYYLAGHEDWVKGRPTPYLPGPAKWTLVLKP